VSPFARAALFVSVLSASVVALSLIGTSRPDFRTFALILLPVALFVGIGTFVRLDDSNREEALWVVAMNRLRHAYVAMVPGLADRFVSERPTISQESSGAMGATPAPTTASCTSS
jgi:hypothetical protein